MAKTDIDLLWVLLSAILVLAMQAGFLCLESGVTRQKNAIDVALKNITDFTVTCIAWWAVGFGLMFGASYAGWFGQSLFFTSFGSGDPWLGIFFFFQMVFCATAATIVSGALAERTRFGAYKLITVVTVVLIYPVFGHWTWGGAFTGTNGWLAELGFVDFAGSTVVHSVGGWVALAAVLVIGARIGRFSDDTSQNIPSSNLPMAMLGVLFLLLGWIGFNGGSTLAFDGQVPAIIVNTLLAGAAGAAVSYLYNRRFPVHFLEGATVPLNGLLAGLVAITAGCHAVSAVESLIIGAVGGVVFVIGSKLLVRMRIDDAVGAVPVHLFAGIWGTLAVALFGDPLILNTGLTMAGQLAVQAAGILVCGAWSFILAFTLFALTNRLYRFRVSPEDEQNGLNVSEHDAHTDLVQLLKGMRAQQETRDMSIRLPVEPFTEVGQIAFRHNELMDSLQRTEAQNRTIITEIRAGIVTLDVAGCVTSLNPAACEMLGMPAARAIGHSLATLLNIQSAADLVSGKSIPLNTVQRLLVSECQLDMVCEKPSGETQYLEFSISSSDHSDHSFNCLINDVSDRRVIEDTLFAEQERTQVTLDSIADGVITTDADGCILYMNPISERLTGWELREARGERLHRVFPVVDSLSEMPSSKLADYVLGEKKSLTQSGSKILYTRSGAAHALRRTAAPIFDRSGRVIGMVVVFQDVTQDRVVERQLSYQATHDGLTGLINRTEFEKRLAQLIDETHAKGSEHVVCFVDLDQFKVVNDVCGHGAGDELLKQLSRQVKDLLRGTDTLARLGGDEFGVILSNCGLEEGKRMAEKFRQSVERFKFPWEGKEFTVGASIGLTPVSPLTTSVSDLLRLADAACYAAKDSGRNRVHVYEPDDVELIDRHKQMKWVSRIRSALEEDRLLLCFQTIVPVNQPEDTSHFEVLLRLIDEEGNEVPPGAFIPAAERYNLMSEIDRWVISHTLEWLSEQKQQSGNNVSGCAINLSGESMGKDDFLDFVIESFEQYAIDPRDICFEITETVAISNLQRASHFIAELNKLGCKFALDDFGSGLSSFGYLKNLAVDYLKIDGAFIKDIHTNEVDKAMVQSINSIANTMGLQTIAEFVESGEILAILDEIGVDFAQGYHISKPRPLDCYDTIDLNPQQSGAA